MLINNKEYRSLNKLRSTVEKRENSDFYGEKYYEEDSVGIDNKFLESLRSENRLRRSRIGRINKIKSLTESILQEKIVNLLSETFVDSLLLDDLILENIKEDALEYSKNSFNYMIEEIGLEEFMVCESVMLNETYYLLEEESEKEAKEEVDGEDEKELDTKSRSSAVKSNMKGVSNKVKDKVKKVIERENKIAEINKETEDELKDVKEESMSHSRYIQASRDRNRIDTMFRVLHENTFKKYHEVMEEDSDLVLEEAPEIIYDETIINYTLLEFLNTIEVIEFDTAFSKNLMRVIRNS